MKTKEISIFYDTSLDAGTITALYQGVEYKSLDLNPYGGNVGIGTTKPAGTLDVENGSKDATFCLNGSCLQSVVPTTYSNSNSSPTLNPNWGYIDIQCSVSCKTGHVVSGGCSVGGDHWSSIDSNQPSGNGWYCGSHALPQFPMNPPSSVDTLNCYALCE